MTNQSGTPVSDDSTTIRELKGWMQHFVDERNWQQFHNAKNLSMSMAIEAGELMEHFQWLTSQEAALGEGFDQNEVADELADVLCYALSLANTLDIDLAQAIHRKMAKNRLKYPAP